MPRVIVEPHAAGPVGAYALRVFDDLTTRSALRRAVRSGRLTMDGQPVSSSVPVLPGAELALTPAPPREPFPLDLSWHHVDDHVAVAFKPPGLPTKGHVFRTLEHAVPHTLPPSPCDDALPWPHCVHRLDVRTQGLVLVARTASADRALGRAFQERRVHKTYRAVVVGRLVGEGTVGTPVDGREAHTTWRVLHHTRCLETDWVTTLALHPRTGRRHQLRRHLAELGHPVLGDDLYTEGRVLTGRGLFLAALGLELAHPVTGEPLVVTAEEPARFEGYRRRSAARWVRHHG